MKDKKIMKLKNIEIEKVNEDEYIVSNHLNRKFVKLGVREVNYLIEILGGQKFEEKEEYSVVPLEEKQKEILYHKFKEWNFLDENKKAKQKRNFSDFRLFVFQGKLFESWCRALSHFFSKFGFVLLILSTIGKFSVYFLSGRTMQRDLTVLAELKISFVEILLMYILHLTIIFIHESSHASTCYKYSGKCGYMGLKMFYLFPTFFCDVSSMYVVSDKKKNTIVAMAGLLSNFLLGNLLLILYAILSNIGFDAKILLYYYGFNWVVIIMNLLPFAKWDGYWLVKSVVKIDNLYDKSVLAFMSIFRKDKIVIAELNIWTKLYGGFIYLFHWLLWAYTIYIFSGYLLKFLSPLFSYIILGCLMGVALRDAIRFTRIYHKKYENLLRKEEFD